MNGRQKDIKDSRAKNAKAAKKNIFLPSELGALCVFARAVLRVSSSG
jgi:hypothetical protein